MKGHFHATVDSILLYGVSAIIVINLTRIVAAKLGTMPGALGTVGQNVGALVHFGN